MKRARRQAYSSCNRFTNLYRFYNVYTAGQLINKMAEHIYRLQNKLADKEESSQP